MKRALLFFLITVAVISCSAGGKTVPDPQPPTVSPLSSLPPAERSETFEVDTWVDDPNPSVGGRVILHGSLLRDGLRLGGMMMQATWPDEGQERGVPNCSVQVIYGAGVCIVEGDDFQPGEYVPITVTFEYQGRLYSGGTGFTPR